MKKLCYLVIMVMFAYACSGNSSNTNESDTTSTEAVTENADEAQAQIDYDARLGEGKFNEDNFELAATVDPELAKKGDAIYSAKCQSCHKLTDEQLVGPGFAGVSERRTPVWVMNFLTNTDEMIDLDPALQEQLEVCMVRMPDQALTDNDAHSILEFFRKNDGVN